MDANMDSSLHPNELAMMGDSHWGSSRSSDLDWSLGLSPVLGAAAEPDLLPPVLASSPAPVASVQVDQGNPASRRRRQELRLNCSEPVRKRQRLQSPHTVIHVAGGKEPQQSGEEEEEEKEKEKDDEDSRIRKLEQSILSWETPKRPNRSVLHALSPNSGIGMLGMVDSSNAQLGAEASICQSAALEDSESVVFFGPFPAGAKELRQMERLGLFELERTQSPVAAASGRPQPPAAAAAAPAPAASPWSLRAALGPEDSGLTPASPLPVVPGTPDRQPASSDCTGLVAAATANDSITRILRRKPFRRSTPYSTGQASRTLRSPASNASKPVPSDLLQPPVDGLPSPSPPPTETMDSSTPAIAEDAGQPESAVAASSEPVWLLEKPSILSSDHIASGCSMLVCASPLGGPSQASPARPVTTIRWLDQACPERSLEDSFGHGHSPVLYATRLLRRSAADSADRAASVELEEDLESEKSAVWSGWQRAELDENCFHAPGDPGDPVIVGEIRKPLAIEAAAVYYCACLCNQPLTRWELPAPSAPELVLGQLRPEPCMRPEDSDCGCVCHSFALQPELSSGVAHDGKLVVLRSCLKDIPQLPLDPAADREALVAAGLARRFSARRATNSNCVASLPAPSAAAAASAVPTLLGRRRQQRQQEIQEPAEQQQQQLPLSQISRRCNSNSTSSVTVSNIPSHECSTGPATLHSRGQPAVQKPPRTVAGTPGPQQQPLLELEAGFVSGIKAPRTRAGTPHWAAMQNKRRSRSIVDPNDVDP